ncbi:hypothetical protein HK098_002306 [Nowakowskiella sp. JEL0407]|nr:hypothetical protein HK098_002306 [Nowakowskiella sp. JEL0407]
MHSGMTLGDILDELTSLSPFLGGILVALTYSPLMILFFPKSVLGGITGFIFKLPNGIFVELLGTFLGIASVLLVGRNVLGPIIYMDWSKKLRRRSVAHTVGSIAEVNEERPLVSSGQNIAGYTTTASGEKPKESFLRQKIPAWVKSFRKKLRVGRKLYEKQGGWRLVFLLAFSPAVPVHITTYLVSIIGVPFHISLWTIFMCNIPYSCIYVFIGASAKNLSDIITGGGDDENLWWKIPLMLISIITIALIAFFVVKYGGQMVAEVDKEDDDAAEAELLGEEGSTEEEFDSFNEDDEEVDLNDSRV